MRNEVIKILITLMLFAGMTGIAAAASETISVRADGTKIITDVGVLAKDKFYQIRYYPPGTFTCNTGYNNIPCAAEIVANPDATHTNGIEWSTGDNTIAKSKDKQAPKSTHSETFDASSKQGVWAIGLFHGGKGGASITSYKVNTKVSTEKTIPEFPTVAIPIAAVIGLVFFFQHRKKKEE